MNSSLLYSINRYRVWHIVGPLMWQQDRFSASFVTVDRIDCQPWFGSFWKTQGICGHQGCIYGKSRWHYMPVPDTFVFPSFVTIISLFPSLVTIFTLWWYLILFPIHHDVLSLFYRISTVGVFIGEHFFLLDSSTKSLLPFSSCKHKKLVCDHWNLGKTHNLKFFFIFLNVCRDKTDQSV